MDLTSRKPEIVRSPADLLDNLETKVCRKFTETFIADMEGAGGIAGLTKSVFDITRYAPVITYMMLIDVNGPDDMRIKLLGEAVREFLGAPLRDTNYLDFVMEERRESVSNLFMNSVSQPFGYWVVYDLAFPSGITRRAESICMPLGSDRPGTRGHLLSVEVPYGSSRLHSQDLQSPLYLNIVSRKLIDLGHGVDLNYMDLLRE